MSISFAFIGMLIVLVVVLPLIALLVLLVVRASVLPRRLARTPVCGACGYEHNGWTTCPECGGELTKVGLITPRLALRLRGSMAIAAVALAILTGAMTALVGVTGQGIFESRGYVSRHASEQLYVSSGSPAGAPLAQLNYVVNVCSEIEFSGAQNPRSGEIVLAADSTGASAGFTGGMATYPGLAQVHLDPRTQEFTIADKSGAIIAKGSKFAEADALILLKTAGIVAPAEALERSAKDIVAHVQMLRTGPLAYAASRTVIGPPGTLSLGGGGRSSGTSSPIHLPGLNGVASWWALMVLVGIATYFTLFALIARRRRRLMA